MIYIEHLQKNHSQFKSIERNIKILLPEDGAASITDTKIIHEKGMKILKSYHKNNV